MECMFVGDQKTPEVALLEHAYAIWNLFHSKTIQIMRVKLIMYFVFFTVVLFGQSPPKRILGSFIFDGVAYNYEFTNEAVSNYSFRISKANRQQSDEAVASEESESGEDGKYIFSEFQKAVFESIFSKQMIEKFPVSDTPELKDKATEIFFLLTAKLDFMDDEPITAYLILRHDTISSLLKANSSVYYNGPLSRLTAKHKVDRVDVEIEEGAIKNLKVHVIRPYTPLGNTSPRTYLEFKNIFPISISGKYDADLFSNIRLYCLNCAGIKGLQRFIKLSDLLLFDIVLQNDKENYSPTNSVIALKPSSPIVELKKEKRSKILEVAAFTDFVGLDQQEPNGLIQIEAKRRINIVTKYRQVRRFETVDDFANQLDLSGMQEKSREEKNKNIILGIK